MTVYATRPGRMGDWLFSRPGRLALALLFVELLAGMQSFMQATIGPEIARDLDADKFFALIYSSALASSFLTLPWGPRAVEKFGVARLMLALTAGNALGAAVSALAPNIGVFTFGRILAGVTSGLMATASMSAVVKHLPANWRRMVLSTFSATYIISSTAGPAYAGAVTHLLGWRWSMVLYVPFLIAARWVISRNIDPSVNPTEGSATPSISVALIMPVAAFAVALSGGLDPVVAIIVATAGVSAIFFGAIRLLPKGVFSGKTGRHRAVLVFFLVTGLYFALDSILPLLAKTVAGASVGGTGVMLMVGGLAWAVVGFLCGRYPAGTKSQYHRRVLLGLTLMVIGPISVASVSLAWPNISFLAFVAGWGLCSIGMGLTYLDTMNAIFTPPESGDDMTDSESVASVAFSEQIAAILLATPAAALTGYFVSQSQPERGLFIVLIAGVALFGVLLLARRASDALP